MAISTVFKRVRPAAALIMAIALVLAGSPTLAADPPKTLALVDFAVRAPAASAAENAWLGPAVAELLQAKMQLFAGARILERSRVGSPGEKALQAADDGDDAPSFPQGIAMAEILVAGSVSLPPDGSPAIKVHARAFETATGRIIVEAVFEGTTDLAGLLKITEELAKALAGGLNLGYTAEQLAYAEPAKIDTLKVFVEGERQLAAGRHRDAIATLQRALEGNEGRYYAAAHRLQGEAYQALALAAAGNKERTIREEYLKKFKEDALVAAGAIYDVGLAYEANSMWREAAAAYTDYIASSEEPEDTVLWRRPIGADFLYVGGATISIISQRPQRWTVFDAGSGENIHETELPTEAGSAYGRPIGATGSRAYLWKMQTTPALAPASTSKIAPLFADYDQGVVALDTAGKVLWQRSIVSGFVFHYDSKLHDGMLFLLYGMPGNAEELKRTPPEKMNAAIGKSGPASLHLVTLDAASGEILSRVVLSARAKTALGLDVHGATMTVPEGVYDLRTGILDRSAPGDRLPTGRKGILYREETDGTRLYRHGKEMTFLPGARLVLGFAAERDWNHGVDVHDGQILLRGPKGYLLVDPDLDRVTTLYADFIQPQLPALIDRSPSLLLFSFSQSRDMAAFDSRYGGLATTVGQEVVNLLDPADGRLVGKGILRTHPRPIALLGGDVLTGNSRELVRVRIASRGRVVVVPAAEARLRLATCFMELGELPRAREELVRFDETSPGDVRGLIQRVRMESLAGNLKNAAFAAVKAMQSGGLPAGDLPAVLEAYRVMTPGVRSAYRLPINGRFQFLAVIAPGLIVMAQEHPDRSSALVLLDTTTGQTRVLPVLDFPSYLVNDHQTEVSGRFLYISSTQPQPLVKNIVRIDRVDILTGERVSSPTISGFYPRFVPGMGARAVIVIEAGIEDLIIIDPQSLAVTSRSHLGQVDGFPIYVGNGLVVLTRAAKFFPAWNNGNPDAAPPAPGEREEVPLVVLEQATGRVLYRTSYTLENERIVAACADHNQLIVGITGRDFTPAAGEGRGLWYRIHATALKTQGKAWSLEGEGFVGGTMLLEERGVTFPLYEGRLPKPFPFEFDGKASYSFGAHLLPLRAVTLDPSTGERVGLAEITGGPGEPDFSDQSSRVLPEEYRRGTIKNTRAQSHSIGPVRSTVYGLMVSPAVLDPLFVPEALRRLIPGTSMSLHMATPWAHRDLFFYRPDLPPLSVLREDPLLHAKILFPPCENCSESWSEKIDATVLLWQDRLYYSVGGGVVLVKDFDNGNGISPGLFAPQELSNILR